MCTASRRNTQCLTICHPGRKHKHLDKCNPIAEVQPYPRSTSTFHSINAILLQTCNPNHVPVCHQCVLLSTEHDSDVCCMMDGRIEIGVVTWEKNNEKRNLKKIHLSKYLLKMHYLINNYVQQNAIFKLKASTEPMFAGRCIWTNDIGVKALWKKETEEHF